MCSPPTCSAPCDTHRYIAGLGYPPPVLRLICANCHLRRTPKPQPKPKQTK